MASLEKKVAHLSQKYETLYHRSYARLDRRKAAFKKQNEILSRWIKRTEKFDTHMMQKLGRLLASLKKGRVVLTLTPLEYVWIKNQVKNRSIHRKEKKNGHKKTLPQTSLPDNTAYPFPSPKGIYIPGQE